MQVSRVGGEAVIGLLGSWGMTFLISYRLNQLWGGDTLDKVTTLIGLLVSIMLLAPVLGQLPGEQKKGLSVKWYFNTSAAFPGKSFGAGHVGGIAACDADRDGKNEIYFGTRRGDSKRLWCLNPDGTLKWVYPRITEDGLPGDPTTKISFVDVNNDGKYEICLAGRGGKFQVLKSDGSVLWVWNNPSSDAEMYGGPQAYDVDGDGFVEFFVNDNKGYIYRLDHTGKLVWTSAQSGSGNNAHPAICDIDRDGAYDIVYASLDRNVYCISADTGMEKWRFDVGGSCENALVADVNNDGEYEVVVWTESAQFFVVSFYGTELGRWSPVETTGLRLQQAMGDVDGDGSMEMVIMTNTKVYVVDIGKAKPVTKWGANLTQLSREGVIPAGAIANQWSSYQLIADIDGDGAQEILWLAPYPIVMDAKTGAVKGYYVNSHIAINRRAENGAWWGDVDGDGVSEWIAELNGNTHGETMVYCLTMNGKFPANGYWTEFYHCSLPGSHQAAAGWLKLKASASNSMWFPISEAQLLSIAALVLIGLMRGRE